MGKAHKILDYWSRNGGIGFIVAGIGVLVTGVIVGAYLQKTLTTRFLEFNAYTINMKWNDKDYMDCRNESRDVYMWNMLNPSAVLEGAVPSYEQKGPYNFTVETCQFVSLPNFTGRIENYREYVTYFYNVSGNQNDMITNYNPGYLGIMQTLMQQGFYNNPEMALQARATGPALEQVLAQLTSPTFTNQVQTSGIPTVLLQIQSTAINTKLIPTIYAAAGVRYALLQWTTYSTNYFNNRNYMGGVTWYWAQTTNPANCSTPCPPPFYSNETINLVLYGNGTNQPYGWFLDTQQGTYLSLMNQQWVSGSSQGRINMATSYLTDIGNLTVLMNYVQNVLLINVGNLTLGYVNINSMANQQFYNQWANGTTQSTGFDIYNNGTTPAGFELGTNFNVNPLTFVATNLSANTTQSLWNPLNVAAITNSSGILAWFSAINETRYGIHVAPASKYNYLKSVFGLDDQYMGRIMYWLTWWQNTTIIPLLQNNFKVSKMSDLGWLQWGTGGVLPGGQSVNVSMTTLPAAPEFFYYANLMNSPTRFNVSQSQYLLSTSPFRLFNGTNVLTFFALYYQGSYGLIQAMFGLSKQDADTLAFYLQQFIIKFVNPQFYSLFAAGGGPITTRTVYQWCFNAVDPLVIFLGQKTNAALLRSKYTYYSKEEALNGPFYRRKIWFSGVSRDDLFREYEVLDFAQTRNSTIYFWKQPLNVSGNGWNGGGNFFPPPLRSDEDSVSIWSDTIARPAVWNQVGDMEAQGISLKRYELDQSLWEDNFERPENDIYFQTIAGILNMTSNNPFQTLLSRPQMYGVPEFVRQQSIGLLEPTEYDNDWFLGIEPRSGVSMVKDVKIQINAGIPNLQGFYHISPRIAVPLMWVSDPAIISESQSDDFKTNVDSATRGSVAALVLGVLVGFLMMVFGFMIIVRVHRKISKEKYRKQGQVELRSLQKSEG